MTEPARSQYGGFVSRAVALVVDAVVVAVVAAGALVFVQLMGTVFGAQTRDFARAVIQLSAIILPVLMILYDSAFWALAGRTPGMALVGVRVVTTGGREVSWLSSLIRAVVLVVFPVGALWSLVDRRHQAVHDKLARTTVVRLAPVPFQPVPLRGGSAGMQPARPRPSG